MCDNLYGLKTYSNKKTECNNESIIFWNCMNKYHGIRFCVTDYFKLKKCIDNAN